MEESKCLISIHNYMAILINLSTYSSKLSRYLLKNTQMMNKMIFLYKRNFYELKYQTNKQSFLNGNTPFPYIFVKNFLHFKK